MVVRLNSESQAEVRRDEVSMAGSFQGAVVSATPSRCSLCVPVLLPYIGEAVAVQKLLRVSLSDEKLDEGSHNDVDTFLIYTALFIVILHGRILGHSVVTSVIMIRRS